MKNFRYEPIGQMAFYMPMFQEMMEKLGNGTVTMVLPPPVDEARNSTTVNFWFAMNAMAYGIRKGLALAEAEMEVVPQNGKTD